MECICILQNISSDIEKVYTIKELKKVQILKKKIGCISPSKLIFFYAPNLIKGQKVLALERKGMSVGQVHL